MGEIGHYFLAISWALALFGAVGGVYAGISRKPSWHRSVINSTISAAFCAGGATLALGYGFLDHDYTNQYIWQYSNRNMDAAYKLTAIWGGMDGSMLLWAAILTIVAAIVAWNVDRYPTRIMPWFFAMINSSSLFFLTVTLFFSNPFRYLQSDIIPPDGNGLNPLLQNPYMAVHPPMLYAGFTLYAVPFAFAAAALLAGKVNDDWLHATRRWSLIAWAFLTIGIVLGGYWAYIELGWGGFWAWDPVENASFLPWLTGTAFLHAIIVQKRRGILKLWNIWLITITYALTIFGTFLTRSGIVQSVHSFASTNIGWVFLFYLGAIFVFVLLLTTWRRKELSSNAHLESLFSRETAFLLSNLVFVSLCFATLWGVMFPVLSEAATGTKQTVGAPYFNTINVPLFLLMLLLMGVGPLIAWRKGDLKQLGRDIRVPFLGGSLLGLLLIFVWGLEVYPVICYALCFLVLLTIIIEFIRETRAIRSSPGQNNCSFARAAALLVRKKQRLYGGHLVHIGVLIAAVSITAASAHKIEQEFTLSPGGSKNIGGYVFTLNGLFKLNEKNYGGLQAVVTVSSEETGEVVDVLRPERRSYGRNRESTTEVALRVGVLRDIYLIVAGLDQRSKRTAFKAYINPLQAWLWFGVVVMILGTGLAVSQPVGVSKTANGDA